MNPRVQIFVTTEADISRGIQAEIHQKWHCHCRRLIVPNRNAVRNTVGQGANRYRVAACASVCGLNGDRAFWTRVGISAHGVSERFGCILVGE